MPDPLNFPLRCWPPTLPFLGLSSELHVAWLPTASCDKPSCLLTTSFLMLAGETGVVAASVSVSVCTDTHHTGFKGTSSKKKKSFQMIKHRLLDECLLLIVFVVSPSLFHMSIIVSVFNFHSLSFFFIVLIFGSFTLYLRSISKYFYLLLFSFPFD